MIRQLIRLLLASLCLLVCGCSTGNSQSSKDIENVLSQLDNGSVKNNVYENKLLGLKIPFPRSMKTDTSESLAPYLKEGIELLKSDKPSDQRLLEEMLRKDRIVFTLDSPEADNSLGASMSLTIKKDDTTEQLEPMIDRTIKFLTSNGKQKVVVPISDISLSNIKFRTVTLSMDVEGVSVLSKLYISRRNGYLLTFSIAYADDAGLSGMEPVLKGIEFF